MYGASYQPMYMLQSFEIFYRGDCPAKLAFNEHRMCWSTADHSSYLQQTFISRGDSTIRHPVHNSALLIWGKYRNSSIWHMDNIRWNVHHGGKEHN